MAGLFITFEGVECSGKSLQSKYLHDYCIQNNIPVLLVREPGGTPTGESLREILLHQDCVPLTEFFILSASRAHLTQTVIKPHLEKDFVVICDRYFHSSLAYQGYARNLDIATLKQISLIATQDLQPEICFLLEPSFEICQERLTHKRKQSSDRIEQEDFSFHHKVYTGYQDIATQYPYIKKIDGNLDPTSIHQEIISQLKTLNKHF